MGRMGVKAFALTVEDMEATAAALRERDVTFVQEPKPGSSFNGWRAEILDPKRQSVSNCASGSTTASITMCGNRRAALLVGRPDLRLVVNANGL